MCTTIEHVYPKEHLVTNFLIVANCCVYLILKLTQSNNTENNPLADLITSKNENKSTLAPTGTVFVLS